MTKSKDVGVIPWGTNKIISTGSQKTPVIVSSPSWNPFYPQISQDHRTGLTRAQ